jgi:antitoxin component of MazEF toxin-antitoxin module
MASDVFGKAKKVGGSLMVVIPKEVAGSEGIQDGTMVRFQIAKKRAIPFGMFRGMGSWKGHEGDWGHD